MHCFGDTGTFRVLMMLEIGHSLTISLLVFVQLALADVFGVSLTSHSWLLLLVAVR